MVQTIISSHKRPRSYQGSKSDRASLSPPPCCAPSPQLTVFDRTQNAAEIGAGRVAMAMRSLPVSSGRAKGLLGQFSR